MKITLLYDNRSIGPTSSLTPGSGFSAFIEFEGKNIIFDTGADSMILSKNMEMIGINKNQVDMIFLSHDHCDHVGGLSPILRSNPNVNVYILESFSQDIKDKVSAFKGNLTCIKEPVEIENNIQSTGEMEGVLQVIRKIAEQSLIFKTEKGLVLIVGCAHPGILEIVEKAEELTGTHGIHLALGGFHLLEESDAEIDSIAHSLRSHVEIAAPCHCSGDQALKSFERIYKENYLACGVGRRIII